MENPYSDQPSVQQAQGTTEPTPPPHPQPYPGMSSPPNPGYPGYQSIPLPPNVPPSGYQTGPQYQNQAPAPGSYPQYPPVGYYGQPSQAAVPPYSGYQRQGSQNQLLGIIRQLIEDSKLVILRPSIAKFDSIKSHANWTAYFLELLIIGAAYALAGLFLGPGGLAGGLIGTFSGALISLGVAMLVAKALGGDGDFKTYAYVGAVIDLPLGIADAASLLLPPISPLVFLLGIGYGVYVGAFATASVHHLTLGKSYLVWIIGLVIKIGVPLCAFGVIAMVVLTSIFSQR